MISKKDSRPFLIKQAIGGKQTNKETTVYEENWTTVYGLISKPSGSIYARLFGLEEVYDKVLIVNATANTKAIQNNTLIMLDDYPTSNYPYGDYDIARIYPPYNGEIRIGLTKREAVDMPKLYYDSESDDILYYQLNYDKNTLKAYTKANNPLPFEIGDYVWTREPSNNQVVDNILELKSKTRIGFDNNYKPFYELLFEEPKNNENENSEEENNGEEPTV